MSAPELQTIGDFEHDIFRVYASPKTLRKIASDEKFKETNTLWNNGRFNSKDKCGALAEMIRPLPKGSQLDDWVDLYFDTVGGDVIWDNIAEWHDALPGRSWRFAVNSYLYRVIDQTFQGMDGENRAIEALRNDPRYRGCKFRFANDHEDRVLGMDIIAMQRGKVTHGFQVKPRSYFSRHAKGAQLDARIRINPEKYEKFGEKYPGARAFYINHDDLTSNGSKYVNVIPVADVADGIYFG